MTFVLRMVGRGLRASWRRLAFIVLVTHDGELASGTDVTLRMRDGRTERVSPMRAEEVPA